MHCDKNSEGLSFLNRFTDWIKYEHKVRALLADGRTTPLPINKLTLEDVFETKFRNANEVKSFLDSIRNKLLVPQNSDEFFEANVGNKLADIFFRPYTRKMWGMDPRKLEISIGARLPIRTNEDTRYFDDNFQALPKQGYTKMVEKILDHPNIKVTLNKSYEKGMEIKYDKAFLCIPIDKFYEFRYGILPYRSIIFEDKKHLTNDLPSAVVNFTDESCYTRKTQWSLFPNSYGTTKKIKTITYERPCTLEENPNEYYYPILTKDSAKIYQKYKKLSRDEDKIIFCGRTGLYKYIDMIPAVNIHLRIAKDFLKIIY